MHWIFTWLRDGGILILRITEEFEVDSKTALRAVEFRRDRMGLPIEYDEQRHGYFFTKPVASFPGVPVNQERSAGGRGRAGRV